MKYYYPVHRSFESLLILAFVVGFGNSHWLKAEELALESKEKHPPIQQINLLSVSSRIDTSYSGGGAVSQGFSIPSIRLTAYGTAVKHVDYRLSLGQTREFSTASLPQILPVEAYLNVSARADTDGSDVKDAEDMAPKLRFRLGLFAPLMNPWWTPDLSEVDMPDYHETHKALFLSRDLGAEIHYEPIKEVLELGVGAFNGTGIFSQNTNNGKAFTGYVKLNFQSEKFRFSIGSGNFIFNQSSPGSVNYKSSSASNLFASVDWVSMKLTITLDAFVSHFEDSTRGISPRGGAGTINLGVLPWLRLFARIENANRSPLLSGQIRHYQLGPEFVVNESLKAFFTYQQLETGNSTEKMLTIRVRLSV